MSSAAQMSQTTFGSILKENKQKMSDIEKYRSESVTTKSRNYLFMGLTGVTSIMFVLFATQIIAGVFALFLTGVMAVGGWFGYRGIRALSPAIMQKTKNLNIKMMVEEAKRNAVVQLDRQVLENTERLKKGREARDMMGGTLSKMKTELSDSEEDTNSSFYKQKEEVINRVQSAYDHICKYLDSAKAANERFETKVSEYKKLDKLSAMAEAALSTFDSNAGIDINEMLSLEAFESIDDSFHTSLTALENQARDLPILRN